MSALGTNLYNNKAFEEAEQTFSAFSGADIVAYIGHKRVATLQGITVSITREVMPVFVMGDPSPKAFTKGKRAIAGNLVFTQFDKHAILKMSKEFSTTNFIGDLNYFKQRDLSKISSAIAGQTTAAAGTSLTIDPTNNDDLRRTLEGELAETYALVATRRFKYSDQVPPFDVTITMVSETGQAACTAVFGVQLVNEGWGYTLDDLNSEAAFTFVARSIQPLDTLAGDLFGTGISNGLDSNG